MNSQSKKCTNSSKKDAKKSESTKSLGYWYCMEFDEESGIYYEPHADKREET